MLTVADTAFAIAQVRADEGLLPPAERLFEDPLASVFVAAGAHAREGVERFLSLPFFRDGIRLRTRALDDFVRAELAAGCRQVVLLGAGFDTRAQRLAEVSAVGAKVFEVDYEEQLRHKAELLAGAGVSYEETVRAVGCDLADERCEGALREGLSAKGFRLGERACVVIEGVLSYLGPGAIERTLRLTHGIAGSSGAAAMDYGFMTFSDGIDGVARAQGFASAEESDGTALWRRYLPGEPHENAWAFRTAVLRRA